MPMLMEMKDFLQYYARNKAYNMQAKIYKLLLALLEKMYYNIMCNRASIFALPFQCIGVIFARVCSRLRLFLFKLTDFPSAKYL